MAGFGETLRENLHLWRRKFINIMSSRHKHLGSSEGRVGKWGGWVLLPLPPPTLTFSLPPLPPALLVPQVSLPSLAA